MDRNLIWNPIKHRLSKVYDFEPDVIDEMFEDMIVTITQQTSLYERLTIITDYLGFSCDYFTLIWLMLNAAADILFTENS